MHDYHEVIVLARSLKHQDAKLQAEQQAVMKKFNARVVQHARLKKNMMIKIQPEAAPVVQESYLAWLGALSARFIAAYQPLIKRYEVIFKALDEMTGLADLFEDDDVSLLSKVLSKAVQRHHGTVFTEKEIRRLQEACDQAVERLGEEKQKQDIINDNKLFVRIKEADKLLSKKEEYWSWLGEKLGRELDEDMVSPDFLSSMTKLLDDFLFIEQTLRKLRKGVKDLVRMHVHALAKEQRCTDRFIHEVAKDIGGGRFRSVIEQRLGSFNAGQQLGHQAFSFMEKELAKERAERSKVADDVALMERFLAQAKQEKASVPLDERVAA